MNSNWIGDMAQFYGMNLFMAERPPPPAAWIRCWMLLAQRRPRLRRAPHHFATNGTSTCNKIVVQALVKPDDIVLDRNCHKSHHYGLVLAGAQVAYLDLSAG